MFRILGMVHSLKHPETVMGRGTWAAAFVGSKTGPREYIDVLRKANETVGDPPMTQEQIIFELGWKTLDGQRSLQIPECFFTAFTMTMLETVDTLTTRSHLNPAGVIERFRYGRMLETLEEIRVHRHKAAAASPPLAAKVTTKRKREAKREAKCDATEPTATNPAAAKKPTVKYHQPTRVYSTRARTKLIDDVQFSSLK